MKTYLKVIIAIFASTVFAKDSYFFPQKLMERAQVNTEKYEYPAQVKRGVINAAEKYLSFSDEQLWDMMFGASIDRSWMVWSDGHCPSCRKPVIMYNWKIDPFKHPWKLQCPNCSMFFPTNDFETYYKSGLNERGVFVFELADKSLLYNTAASDPADPLHKFGVDDGHGYIDGEKKWRFIGTYLIYGQWKAMVLDGIKKTADAYTLTGDVKYSHIAAILLDRVADLYPDFDYITQAVVYEKDRHHGYVSVWHDACEETRELATAYDQIKTGISKDNCLVEFLAGKAARYNMDNPKTTPELIYKNIERGILQDAIENNIKIQSNYPNTDIALAVMHSILGNEDNHKSAEKIIDSMIIKATLVDGVTGEKGLCGYAAGATHNLARFLGLYSRRSDEFLPHLFARHPQLAKTWRFHIDTLCIDSFYPLAGDALWFGAEAGGYRGVFFQYNRPIEPSLYSFFNQMYEVTGDHAYIQALYQGNLEINTGISSTLEINRNYTTKSSVHLGLKDLPRDVFGISPVDFQRKVGHIIDKYGSRFDLESVNKNDWCLAILRSGNGDETRALWVKYDTAGQHGHYDGLNVGLFAKGLDLMPDFGYAPPNHGGWFSDKSNWYRMTAAHNTVVINGRSQLSHSENFISENRLFSAIVKGENDMWAIGGDCKVSQFDGAEFYAAKQYQRMVCLVDIDDDNFYVVDVFRVAGGSDHAKFFGSNFGTVTTQNLELKPDAPYGFGTQMRDFQTDDFVTPPYIVDWEIEDVYKLNPADKKVRLRYTGLTDNVEVSLCQAWVQLGRFDASDVSTRWVPRIMERKRVFSEPLKPIDNLATTFVATIEPYKSQAAITTSKKYRLSINDKVLSEASVAMLVELDDGRKDIFVMPDDSVYEGSDNRQLVSVKELDVSMNAKFCHIRLDKDGQVQGILVVDGSNINCGQRSFDIGGAIFEMIVIDGKDQIMQGKLK